MSLRVEFLSGADADLQEIFNRFEDYRQGFGAEFITVVDAYLARIAVFPEIAPIYFENIRRQVIRDFHTASSTSPNRREFWLPRFSTCDRIRQQILRRLQH